MYNKSYQYYRTQTSWPKLNYECGQNPHISRPRWIRNTNLNFKILYKYQPEPAPFKNKEDEIYNYINKLLDFINGYIYWKTKSPEMAACDLKTTIKGLESLCLCLDENINIPDFLKTPDELNNNILKAKDFCEGLLVFFSKEIQLQITIIKDQQKEKHCLAVAGTTIFKKEDLNKIINPLIGMPENYTLPWVSYETLGQNLFINLDLPIFVITSREAIDLDALYKTNIKNELFIKDISQFETDYLYKDIVAIPKKDKWYDKLLFSKR